MLLALAWALSVAACAPATNPAAPLPASRSGSGGVNSPAQRDKPHLVLVSLDGFKPSYIDRFQLPNMLRVARRGVRARAMIPVFPSLTFPNHYSLVTGLYPDRHGIVSNSFYDPVLGQSYSMSNRAAVSDGTWYRGEPIWVTAETQGMVAACFFWPGSEAAIGGVRPTFWKEFDDGVPNRERVRGVLEWLRLPPERRPHLITVYFSDVDSASHDGPLDSPSVERAARSLDVVVGALLDGIDASPTRDTTYVVLTSDHGMADLTPQQEIPLASLIDTRDVTRTFDGPVTRLHVNGGLAAAHRVRDALNARLERGRAYLREEMPERLHYRRDPRAGDVIVVMDESWTLVTGLRRTVRAFRGPRGMHGWDPELPSMHAVFLAMGPRIPAGSTLTHVDNVDVYSFMAEALALRQARDIDGTPGEIWQSLKR